MAGPEQAAKSEDDAKLSLLARLRALFSGEGGGNAARAAFTTPDFPGAFDSGHSHRRLVWTARTLAVVCVFEALTICAMGFALASLVPLKTVHMALLQVSPASEMVVEVKPLRADVPVMDYMARAWVREYVLNRNTIIADSEAMSSRIRWVRERSSRPVFAEFIDRQRGFLQQAIADRLVRTVEIKAVTRDKQRVALWFVDFVTTDTPVQGQAITRQFRAQVIVAFEPRLTRAGDLDVREIDNPFGFTVQRYDVGALSGDP